MNCTKHFPKKKDDLAIEDILLITSIFLDHRRAFGDTTTIFPPLLNKDRISNTDVKKSTGAKENKIVTSSTAG